MRIDPEDLRRNYGLMSDEELVALDPEDLTETARNVYREELARRGLRLNGEPESLPLPEQLPVEVEDAGAELESGPPPDWVSDAACAYSFTVTPQTPYVSIAARIRAVLRRAGIPCYMTLNDLEGSGDTGQAECCAMVPSAYSLQAESVLDRDLLNAGREEEWRKHLETLSDDELLAQTPEILCAGLLDRVARLKRAWRDETERRVLTIN